MRSRCRWCPTSRPRAAGCSGRSRRAEGFRSSLAVPAHVALGVSLALNLYSREDDPWHPHLLRAADSYAQLVASTVRLRLQVAELEDAAVGLYRRMSDAAAEERAIGALMHANRCSEDEARRMIETAASRHSTGSRREVAEGVVRSMMFPDHADDAHDAG